MILFENIHKRKPIQAVLLLEHETLKDQDLQIIILNFYIWSIIFGSHQPTFIISVSIQ